MNDAPSVWLYRSFAAATGGGSVAGVVLSSSELEVSVMQQLALDLAAPTTGFAVTPSTGTRDAVFARFFTPRQEIGACGHVSVALAAAMVQAGLWDEDVKAKPSHEIHSAGGIIPVAVRRVAGGRQVEMYLRPELEAEPLTRTETIYLGLGCGEPESGLHPRIIGTGLRHLLVPVSDLAALGRLRLDEEAIASLAGEEGVDTIGVFAVTEHRGSHLRVRLRDLCAGIGDLEEPASGTTSSALAAYLAGELAPGHAEVKVEIEQGHEMGRPSLLNAVVDKQDGGRNAWCVRISGQAIPILSGRLHAGG